MGDVENSVGERHLIGQRRPRFARCDRLVRHNEHSLKPIGGIEARHFATGRHDEAAVERCGDIVGMAVELAPKRQQVGIELKEMVGRDQAGEISGGAGS